MSLRLTAERVDHQLRDYMQTKRIAGPWKSGVRLLVGISASPNSVSLIRWARRMAYTMDATWIAVYVETARPLTEPSKNQLAKNIKLARELGAEIITTADEDIAVALVRVARQQNATQLLVGKPHRFLSLRKSLLDQVIERSGDLDVYVVGGEERPSAQRAFRFPAMHSGISQYVSAVAVVCLVALACYPLRSIIGYQTISLIFLLTIALLPLKLGSGPVLLAAALSALLWDYFFIPPQFTLSVNLAQDILMLLTYFAIATVTGTLTARIRAREKAVRSREERATALYTLTRDLSNAPNQDEVAKAAVTNIKKFFKAEVAIFLSDQDGDVFTKAHTASSFTVDEKEFGVAAWVYWNEKKAGKTTDTLPFATATYYPMSGPRYPLGVIGVRLMEGDRLAIDQEALLENFIRQIASTLEREQLNEMTKKSIALAESDRLYKTLFDSISHELRTPIAAIMSASESLSGTASRDPVQRDLSDEIHTAAERLNRLVENLLDMTRLETGRIAPVLDWVDILDLFRSAVKKLDRELADHIVKLDVPDDMPLVTIDFGLIEQVIVNILHNVALYTPKGSIAVLRASVEGTVCTLVVSDNGPGFPSETLQKAFDKFYRIPGTKPGGTGLGLSIARGFVETHKGTMKVENNPDGGARFTIRLPLQRQPHEAVRQNA